MSITKESVNQLRQNARSVVRELGLLNNTYFEIGVTLAERHLLIELVSTPLTSGEIAKRLCLEKSTVSRLIAKAEKKGYISSKQDQNDKRKRDIALTKKGREVLEAFEKIAFNQTKQALLNLTHDEVSVAYEGVALYAKGLKKSRTVEQKDEIKSPFPSFEEIERELVKLGVTLREFEQKDENESYAIYRQVVEQGNLFPYESSSFEAFQRFFFSPGSQVYVCHSKERGIIGCFYMKPNVSSHICNAAYMMKEEERGKGIGTWMIKASLHLAKQKGFHAMQFNLVLSENRQAVRLYQKMEFNIIGTVPQSVRNQDGTFQDGYIMYRSLEDI